MSQYLFEESSEDISYIFLAHLINHMRIFEQKYSLNGLFVHGDMGCGQKSFMLVRRIHQLLPGFLAKGHLPRVSYQLRLSTNDKGDNEIIPRAVHRCLTFTLRLRKTAKNLS